MSDETRSKPKTREAVVVSDKMDKTVVVEIVDRQQHPLYRRRVRQTKRFKAHDENNECREGDKVQIVESRPLSRHKRWRVLEILERAR